jgi:hypothetical protein
MKATTFLRNLKKDNMIGENRDDELAALVCFGALDIGPQKKKEVSKWINETVPLTSDDKKKIKTFWDNLSSGGAIEKGKVYFGGGKDAGIEFALLINIAHGYVGMTHSRVN